ncbi:SDR family NAD(P)-dependent oxidoreductase, partial [Myxococcota bacterium]|nr:SDR family NAD(P)-dependent oxidoreductase [Myxococcota bacterium]
MKDWQGRVAVVTGGAGDIGRAIARALLRKGVRVVVSDVEQGALDRAVRELAPLGDGSGIRTDVSKPEAVA